MNSKKIVEYDVVRAYVLLFVLSGHCIYNTIITDYGGVDIGVDDISHSLLRNDVWSVDGNTDNKKTKF